MKTIGLIGGMSWESTVTYYKIMNQEIKNRLGGFHSAKILLYSVDFAEIEELQRQGEWEKSGELLADVAQRLEQAGADMILIGTNTMHKVAQQVRESIPVPLIHIAEATADELHRHNTKIVALLGTKYTMQQQFYREKLEAAGLTVLVPDEKDMEQINHIIFQELCMGIQSTPSKEMLLSVVDKLAEKGAEGVILGCTELGLLLQQEDSHLPLFDTTDIHAKAAVKLALDDQD
ncbi:MAG: aspartate/glutamate racemase family protein [Clostridia bacterium]|nr:aspartate/glutamate racemase family protein [Clostridia bacterium]